MSYCLNFGCQKPQNLDQAKFCQTCGAKLLLRNRYRAIHPLEEGGFGKTYLAIDEDRLNGRCVIKQLLPQLQGTGSVKKAALDKTIQLFNQEAVRLDELGEHPQIPALLAYFVEELIISEAQESRMYLVQQYIEGENLLQELRRKVFGEAQIRELLVDLLPVLKFVHAHQVIHRDIKPSNIIRRQMDQRLVLIDFGIAKQLTEGGQAGTKIGTEGYAPMEQWRSGKVYPASDLYSLGATCVHLLTRTKPDELFDPLTGKWLWQQHLRQRGIGMSEQLGQILDKLLKDAVGDRYQTADEVLHDLAGTEVSFSVPPSPVFPSSDTSHQNWNMVHTLTGHSDRIRSLAISPDSRILASGSSDNTIKLWDLQTGMELRTLTGHEDSVYTVAISPDNQTLISGSSDRTIKLWHLATGKPFSTLIGHVHWVNAVAIHPQEPLLISGGEDKTLKFWNLQTGAVQRTLTGHTGPIYAVAISADGQMVVSAGGDRCVRVWSTATGELLQTLAKHSNRINAVAISPDRKVIASGSEDTTIKLWHLGKERVTLSLTEHTDAVSSLAMRTDGELLVSGSRDKTVKVWQVKTGRLLKTLTGHSWWVNAVAMSPDGRTIASSSTDKVIQLWQCST